jgi:predicted O-methyltransferase YrrM
MILERLRAVLDPGADGDLREIIPNILRAALKPARAQVMGKKLYRRWHDQRGKITPEQNLAWINANLQDFASIARRINCDLWDEAVEFERRLRLRATEAVGGLQIARAGGGAYPFLYFVTRHVVPECIVETGVAAGYSSRAFLEGIKNNGKGRLFSTDFPLFRNHDPEHAIGILVDEQLKRFWELHTEGDDVGLPSIIKKIATVDVFHYDSDKSYAGRTFAVSIVKPRLHPRSIFIMDDIQDNSYFHDYVEVERTADFATFQFCGKYVGLVGSLDVR